MTSFNTIDFCHHIYQYGLVLEPSRVKVDGKPHNCRMIDNAPGRRAGSYTVYPDTGIAIFKSWRDGVVHKYYPNWLDIKSLSDFKQLMKEQKQKQHEEWFKVSYASYQKFNNIPVTEQKSDYLTRKQVTSFMAKVDGQGNLVIPYYNSNGYIRTLQTITPDGNKLFEKGGQISGCFHPIGLGSISTNYADNIYVGEGFSTMASVFIAMKKPCIAAGNCCNLLPVLDNLTRLYPNARFIICADNDIMLREMPVGSGHMIWSNPGVEAAINCQKFHVCDIVIPDFSQIDSDDLTDFNDLHTTLGIDEVKKQIICQLNPKPQYSLKRMKYSLTEYNESIYHMKLMTIRNYFEYFADRTEDSLTSAFIGELQVDIKTYVEFSVTNLFYDFKLVFVEQIHNDGVLIKYDEQFITRFENKLHEVKLAKLVEQEQRFNALCAELQCLKQENMQLTNMIKEKHG
jgi:phage/plasmid primase-like uncharacterized protein